MVFEQEVKMRYIHKHRSFQIFIILSILSTLSITGHLMGQDVVSFQQFISQFPNNQQIKAAVIWEDIETSSPQVSMEPPEVITEKISDEDLFSAFTDKDKEKFIAQLKGVRSQVADAILERNATQQTYSRWKAFTARIEDMPDMGIVYLKSLTMIQKYQSLLESKIKQVLKCENKIETIRVDASLKQVSLSFTYKDWIVIVVYLIFTTILGGILAGKQASIKDFFLGGRKLSWPAVCGSIMATELSAATFLIAPAIVFSKGGDMTYIQLALGTIIARFIIGYFFIPAYYKHEIYSPYDYMGNQLGSRVKSITSILFMIGGILAQGARVYIAAKALQVITGTNITTSIIIIGTVSIGWTVMGGITTVIWTDAIQFLLFSLGAIAALIFIGTSIDGGMITVIKEGIAAGKFKVLNLNFNPKEAYTLWCGLFAVGFLTLGSHGTDQLMAQRMFTCKNQDHARKAVTWSSLVLIMTLVLLFVGAGIFVYYKYFPLSPPEQVIVDADSMKIFAIYIVNVMPPLLSGLLMAAIFATAISTLDSILAALSQSTISIFYKPYLKPEGSDQHYVRASRVIVLIWGIILTTFAISCHFIAHRFTDLIQFALAMAAYTYGALLGTFLLAFLPTKRDDLGLMWGVPLSILIVFALNWHQPVTQIIVLIACFILIIQAFRRFKEQPQKVGVIGIAVGIVALVSMAVTGYSTDGQPVHISLAWPWHYPIGTAMTFFIGYLVGNKKDEMIISNGPVKSH